MIHPNHKAQENQDNFLKQCPESEKEQHAALFHIGNASFIYHRLSDDISVSELELYYLEWLQGLPPAIRKSMEKHGFEECKSMLSFNRYVNERRDIGMDEWMREHLSKEDYQFYKSGGQ